MLVRYSGSVVGNCVVCGQFAKYADIDAEVVGGDPPECWGEWCERHLPEHLRATEDSQGITS